MDDLELAPELSEPPVPPAEPPVDEAAEAQAARERAAIRGARGQLGRTPVAMTELAPAKITSDEEYAALPPGAYFISPDGQKLRKPWYVADDASYDKVPEGEQFISPDGQKMQKPKYEPLPFTVQTLYDMAVNDKERMRILEQAYPGKVRTTPRGELYVDDDGVRRRTKTITQGSWGGVASQVAPVGLSVAGDILGGIAGAPGGPAGVAGGAIAGGIAGSQAGQAFNDIVLRIAGVYDRSGEEAALEYGKQALGAGAGGVAGRILLPAAPSIGRWAKEAAPGALAKFLGADKDAVKTAIGLREQGVLVPPSAWAKEAPHIQNLSEVLDPAFRTQRPLEQSAKAHMETKGTDVLRQLGIEEPGPLLKPEAAVPTEAAGKAVQARAQEQMAVRLAETDAQLAERLAETRARVMAEDVLTTMDRPSSEALEQAAAANRQAAQSMIDDGFRQIQASVDDAMRAANADVNSGTLWQQVAERLRALRQAVVTRHQNWYQQAHEVAGGAMPDIGNLPQIADDFLGRLPQGFEAQYPSIVQRIRDIAGRRDPQTGAWIVEPSEPTFAQLHQLRTELRSHVNWYSLPSDLAEGPYKFFQTRVSDILHDPNATGNLRVASQMLDATDRSYGANMAAFNDARLNSVIKGIESGLPADPKTLFDALVREGRSDLTSWVRERVGPNLWAGVRAADVQEMLDLSRSLTPGQIDGAKFASEILKRHRHNMLDAVHGAQAAQLMRQAQAVEALAGKIDIPVRPGDTLSEIIARARQAGEAAQVAARRSPLDTLEREMRTIRTDHARAMRDQQRNDPLGFLYNPTVGAGEAADRILASEDTILAAAARFGEKSPEFEMLRQIYAQRVLRGTMDPGRKLGGVSEDVQKLMFPGLTLDQMKTLAKEMEFLMGTKAARGGAGRSIMATERVEHPLTGFLGSVGKYVPKTPVTEGAARAALSWYYKTVTEVMNSPALLRFVLRGLEGGEAERFTARNMINAMLHGKGANRGGALGAGLGAAGTSMPGLEQREIDPAASGAQQMPSGGWQVPSPNQPWPGRR